MLTTQRLVERSLAHFAPRIAVIDGEHRLTYDRLAERTARLANALLALGASDGRPVAVYLPNGFRLIEVDLAAMRAGICRVAIGTRLAAEECRYIVEHAQTAVLITTPDLWERIEGTGLDGLSVLLVGGAGRTARLRDYETTLQEASAELSVAPVDAGRAAYLLYTSGTTGRPKGALHSQGGRVAALVNMLASELSADARSVMVHCGPLSHGSGSKVLTFLALGATNLIMPRFDPEVLAHHVIEHGGSHSFMVPTMLQMLLDAGPEVHAAIRRMHQISFGGAPITNARFGRALETFGPILTQVYGSCEAPHPITVVTPADYVDAPDPSALAETAGRASHATDIAIVDDDGEELGPGQEGELCVRASHLTSGYWRDPAATASVFRAGGWYMTGDIASVDERGFVYLRDRKRDLIITGGLNVYPSEVERVLAEHRSVREVAVVGAPDDQWGETVVACVVPVDRAQADESELIAWIGERLAGYKRPRRVIFMDDLPKGSTNKVLKRELKSTLWEGHARRIN